MRESTRYGTAKERALRVKIFRHFLLGNETIYIYIYTLNPKIKRERELKQRNPFGKSDVEAKNEANKAKNPQYETY